MDLRSCLRRSVLGVFLFLPGLVTERVHGQAPAATAPATCTITVHNTDYDNIFLPADEKKITVTVKNGSADQKTTELDMQGTLDDGTPISFKQSLTVPANGSADVPVTLPLPGPCFADCTFSLNTNDAPSVRTTFAVVRPQDVETVPFDKSFFGTCNMGRPLAAKRIGVRVNRTFIFWKWSEASQGQFGLSRYYSGGKTFEDEGIHMIYTLEPNYPDWVAKSTGIKNLLGLAQPDALKDYSDWAAEAIKEAPPGPKAFEFANEPDISLGRLGDVNAGIATTALLLKTGYDLVKAADPSVPVLGVDVSSPGPRDHDFAEKSLQGADGKIDELSVHTYSEQHYVKTDGSVIWPDEYLYTVMPTNVDLAGKYTSAKGIWTTEVGWAYPWEDTFLSDPNRTFAQIVGQCYVVAKTIPHFEKVCWFRGSTGWGTNERGYDYSLIAQTKAEMAVQGFHPTTGVSAFATTSSLLEGSGVGQKIDLGPALRAYIFENPMSNKVVAAVWSVKYDVSLTTPPPAGVSLIDLYGREHTIADGGKFTINRGPSFIVADLAKEEDFKKYLASATWKPAQSFVVASIGAATTAALDLTVTNFNTADAAVDVTLPSGAVKATLHAGDNAVSTPLPADAFSTNHLDLPLKISDGTNSTDYHVDKQLVAASYAPAGTFAADGVMTPQKTALAANVIDDRNHVYPSDPSVPWKGPQDLSAKFGYAWSEKGLYAIMIATDDIHVGMPANDTAYWHYDCLQMAFGPAAQRAGAGYQPGDHEIGLALGSDGQGRIFQPYPAGGISPDVTYKVTRSGTDTIYEVMLPWPVALGVAQPAANAVINMNFIVSDNDNNVRKCWLGLYDGIADGKRPAFFPWVHLLPKTSP